MKKLLTILLTLFMIFTLVGCNSNNEQPPVVEETEKQEEVVEPVEDEPIVGGFVDAEDKTITDELKDIFNSALEGLMGATYEPVELVATQVVAGTNYKFLANGTKTTNPITSGTYYITIYKDLQGNAKLLDIEVVEEKQEEKEEVVDPTQYSYWVVFYDQYGNELQRTVEKYGSVPEYKSWLPEGFDKWIYKKSGKDVGSFKTITGNTYYQAVCHEVVHKSDDSNPMPTPAPTPVHDYSKDYLTFTSLKDGSQIRFSDDNTDSVLYSKDKQNWLSLSNYVTLNNGEAIYVKGTSESESAGGNSFNLDNSSSFKVSGNLMSLLSPDNFLNKKALTEDDALSGLFSNCQGLTDAYNLVFYAETLSNRCYSNFFNQCSNLERVPNSISAVTLADGCCNAMFEGCKKLTNAPSLPVEDLKNSCYSYMFNGCTSLITAPVLPAKILKESCYSNMFNGCSSLNNISVGFSSFESLPTDATKLWVENVASSGTFKWKGDNVVYPEGPNEIPNGWIVEGEQCLAKGSLITMADGSQKPIEDLKHGDIIMVFDHEIGKLSQSKILDYWHYEDLKTGLITLNFTNGISVDIVSEHSFYCNDENTYIVLNKNNINDYIGKQFYNANNECWETLLSAIYSDEKVETYYLATENHYNCIVEGMLSVEDGLYQVICSTFDYDDNMMIDNQKKYEDINRYGLFTYDSFDYLTKDEFDSHKLGYLKVALGKGLITEADLKLLEEIWTNEKEIMSEKDQ